MSEYYKITKAQAAKIGEIKLSDVEWFDPFVGEQMDGTYLIEVSFLEKYKDVIDLKGISTLLLIKIKEAEILLKIVKP